jgi:redox-sensitive bicupin YhaK (pirin superfamily)
MNARRIIHRHPGHQRSGFKRLASPSDIGQLIKPFVFLDDFDITGSGDLRSNIHPHSGIATVTVVREGALGYLDTTGVQGELETGGVEWMQAGGGVWHSGGAAPGVRARGFQLWLALPAEDELGTADSQYLPPSAIESAGPARIILGSHEGARSPIATRASLNYLHVVLKDGEQWRYQPPAGHEVAWLALAQGALQVSDTVLKNEIAVFEPGQQALEFTAVGDTDFVLGSAVPHPHDLVLGYYSVHTSAQALEKGEAQIEAIRRQQGF